MTYEQYWYGDVWMIRVFRKADELRQRRLNEELWLQGAYVYDAIYRLTPVLHAFAKRGTKAKAYPSKPYDLTPVNSGGEPVVDEKIVANERLKAQLYFKNWAKSVQKQFDAEK